MKNRSNGESKVFKFVVKVKAIDRKSAAYDSLFHEVLYGFFYFDCWNVASHAGYFRTEKSFYLISPYYGQTLTAFSAQVHKYYGYWPNFAIIHLT